MFRANLGAPLATVELSFDGRFELTERDADLLIQIHGGAVLWQKERLLNLALKAVPSDATKIAWFDCDVILKRTDWIDEAKNRLEECNTVQLFSDVVHIGPEDYGKQPDRLGWYPSVPGIVSLPNARDLMSLGRREQEHLKSVSNKEEIYKLGLAWAANRQLLEDHGFYDASIVGSGDRLMVSAMYGRFEDSTKLFLFEGARLQHYLKWAVPFHQSVAGRFSHLPGTIYHLRHGQLKNRQYLARHEQLTSLGFDPDSDIMIGANGAWHWARPRPDLEAFLKSYFVSRAEDE
jgi:hypothetical protein